MEEAGCVGNGEERGRAAGGVEPDVAAGFLARGEGGQGLRWPGGVRLPRPRPSDTRLAWFLKVKRRIRGSYKRRRECVGSMDIREN